MMFPIPINRTTASGETGTDHLLYVPSLMSRQTGWSHTPSFFKSFIRKANYLEFAVLGSCSFVSDINGYDALDSRFGI